ncbi:MAG: glycosyltransferase family 4 protein [Chloroflexi bacterium]|nr:glycosyltransferase family 4 protein [Chloroflexota bacterium]
MSTTRPKVVHLTSVHPPLDTRVFWKECRTLARVGYEVVLVAPDPPVSEKDGVRFVGHPRPKSRLERVVRVPIRLLRIARAEHADLYHFHDPDLLPVGVILALWTRRPVIYDSHEDVPRQLLDRVWIPPRLRPLAAAAARWIERAAVQFLAGVVSAEPGGLTRFPSSKAVLVQNYPLLEEFPPSPVPYRDRENVVVYVGDITKARGADVMVQAMGHIPPDVDARLVIAGKCQVPGLLAELEALGGWDRVEYVGWQSRDEVRRLLHRARIGIVVMQPTAQYRESTQPVKLFEYMAAGLPIVASDFPVWRPLLGPAGLLVDGTAPEEVASAILRILRDPSAAEAMGKCGQQAVHGTWNWSSQEAELVRLYQRLRLGAPRLENG